MNIDPDAYTVLCFGDSNTNGIPSDDEDYVRLAADVRWTGRLQALLGDGFHVIEEGLNGRTTDVDYADRPGCNGRPYFAPCLRTHHPVDVVVIMLGTNDLKTQFDRSPEDIAAALDGYIDDVDDNAANRDGGTPRTILVSPIPLDDTQPMFAANTLGAFDAAAVDKSRRLSEELLKVARARGVHFADAATVARAGGDGLHLRLDGHQPLAELVATTIQDALADLVAAHH
ncbi:hydrolase [Longispora fulva]|uniref:Lysophospholipase L1-like esterase n=1 Tax=Longispora fulva TaxID=619741 RepID=A0A8J7GTA4_9ACTN|nr:GDSL-type esterase/lipase family protein [Longispora fulva]MBG6136786.1 lysophospholipase L1-like esterase [Longispora fulva]GIG59957.1 hydrolase [Longispora fulva]